MKRDPEITTHTEKSFNYYLQSHQIYWRQWTHQFSGLIERASQFVKLPTLKCQNLEGIQQHRQTILI